MRIETDLDGAVVSAIERHYKHAKEKHPYFCDGILSPVEDYEEALAFQRIRITEAVRCNMTSACDLIDCELLEAYVEIAKDNKDAAIEECYDSIVTILRVIDVLEERQALGRPKEGAK